MIPMLRSSLAAGSALAFAAVLLAQAQTPAPAARPPAPRVSFPAPSPTATVKQRVGITDVEIVYSRPGMKGRKIFGGLVPYGEVWRTGANAATRITFSTPVKLGGTAVDAGAYELFTIPNPGEWTVILQKLPEKASWGAYAYDAKKDTARLTAKPAALAAPVETFTIELGDLRDESATLGFVWENTRVTVPLEVDLVGLLVPQIEAAMAAEGGRKPYAQAAMFYLEHNLDLAKAAGWLDTAIAEQPKAFYLHYHKARVLAKQGDKAGAIAAARKSIEIAAAEGGPAKDEYTRLNEALIAGLK